MHGLIDWLTESIHIYWASTIIQILHGMEFQEWQVTCSCLSKDPIFWIPSIFYTEPSSKLIWGNFPPIFSFHNLSLGGDFYCFFSKRAWLQLLSFAKSLCKCIFKNILASIQNSLENSTWLHYVFSESRRVWNGIYHKTFIVALEDGGQIALLRTYDHTTTWW